MTQITQITIKVATYMKLKRAVLISTNRPVNCKTDVASFRTAIDRSPSLRPVVAQEARVVQHRGCYSSTRR